MNILYLAPLVPYPLLDGDRQRAFHLLKALSEKHTVHLCCFVRDRSEEQALQAMKAYCASVHSVPISHRELVAKACWHWFGAKPLNVAVFQKRVMHAQVRELVQRYAVDAIHAYRLRMAPYALQSRGVYRVLDYTDSMTRYFQNRQKENHSWLKAGYIRHELKRLKKYEPYVSDYMDLCLVSSPHDQEIILRQGSAPWIEIVTNGVDTDAFRQPAPRTTSPHVLFVANMAYLPNQQGLRWFCRHCWSMIKKQVPQATLTVIGQPPRGTKTQSHSRYPGARFVGPVENLKAALQEARVGICPVAVASGRQFKVIEYFAAGLPAVTTTVVAANLDAVPEQHLLAADDAQGFADQVVRLLQDNALADRLRQAALTLSRDQYDWSVAAGQLHRLYGKLEAAGQVKDSSQPGSTVEKIKKRKVLRIRRVHD